MNYQVKLGGNNEIPLPDDLCQGLNFDVSDILLCEKLDDAIAIVMSKHIGQSLTDAEIELARNLTRVVLYASKRSA